MRNHTFDDSRSIDGLCVFPECDSPQTDHLRLPVCERHILRTYRLAVQMVNDALPKSGAKSPTRRAVQSATPGLVYFLRFGSLIKIGFTTNLRQRLVALPHDELLATTPGTMRDEKSLHLRFAHLRQKGEWFRQDDDLLAYIGTLRGVA